MQTSVSTQTGDSVYTVFVFQTEPGSSASVVVGVPTAPPPPPAVRDSAVETSNMAVITDPDCLGPCEPGTSVVLEGIVWNETDNGKPWVGSGKHLQACMCMAGKHSFYKQLLKPLFSLALSSRHAGCPST